MKRPVSLCACVLCALQLAACAAPEGHGRLHLMAALSGDQEAPPTGSLGTGTADITLDRASNELTWRITYSGLSEPVTAVHFHSPAKRGGNAEINIRDHLKSPVTGSAILTDEQERELLAGRWFVNIHTVACPNGEVLGHIQP
jgi:CHRD domain